MGGQRHRLLLLDREQLEIDGVQNVESFSATHVVLETNQGLLKLSGEEFHIRNLDLETEKVQLEGLVIAIEYLENRKGLKGKGFLDRLFR